MRREKITEWTLQLLATVIRKFSHPIQFQFGKQIGHLLQFFLPERQKIALQNLRRAFPDRDPQWYSEILKKSFENLGIVFCELLALPSYSPQMIRRMIRYPNAELIEEAATEGKGVLLLSAHYGNWELTAYALPYVISLPVTVVTKRIANPAVNTFIQSIRAASGNTLIPASRVGHILPAIIRQNRALALLADQSARPEQDFYIPLFNIPTLTFRAPAVFALRFKMPIIVGFCERKEDRTYEVKLHRLQTNGMEPTEENVRAVMQQYHLLLEEAIKRKPELWLWQHRRWKHTPIVSSPSVQH